jgi:hypothetical protein
MVLKLKLSVLTLSQRLVTPRTPRISGARLGVQPLQLPWFWSEYAWPWVRLGQIYLGI